MFFKEIQTLIDKNISVATVTIIEESGSSPRGIGSSMLVGLDGLLHGSIGGGAVEFKAIKDAIKALNNKMSHVIHYPLDTLDMTCGGEVKVFIQVFNRKKEILILGGGHICKAILPFANTLGYKTSVIDQRPDIFLDPVFEKSNCIQDDILKALEEIDFHKDMYIIIVTHGHRYDQDSLAYVLNKPHAYIGMIGSENKIKTCYKNLKTLGFDKETLDKVYAPIGLSLGGERPEDIALSIISEIHAISNDTKVEHLRDVGK
ncbi:XdhC family protein [Acidaminobacter sp. JC074]|uniref:XdhC family protein n=1 Tax=Acidaminobacter sp. JC074 TaxID=2530199 RepID=UPI001F0F7B71|nr:XdhC/CoxI family protein [Acidaminobacter sp. JC074]MCH4889764.1 XdhC family protein [Acidaminobacter sp. JC074]